VSACSSFFVRPIPLLF